MKINWKLRFKQPRFYVMIGLSILFPILAYMKMDPQDITSWAVLGDMLLEAVKNPFLLATVLWSVHNGIVDPTTKGLGDSVKALQYKQPK